MVFYKVFEQSTPAELWSYLLLIAAGLILYNFQDYFRALLLTFKLPGPPTVPVIGNCMLSNRRDLLTNTAAKSYELYGPLYRVRFVLLPAFVVLDPETLQTILHSKKHTGKIFVYRLLHNFLGNGLITSSGEKWSSHRKLIQPVFHWTILEKFIETFIDASEGLLEKISTSEKEVNVTRLVNNCVMEVLNEAILGVPIKKQAGFNMGESPFRQGKVVVGKRVTKPWLIFDWIFNLTNTANEELAQKKKLDTFTEKMIKYRREQKAKGEVGRKCLLDYMIDISEANPEFTEEDMINEACTFMLAGQDSVGAAVAFCLFSLAQNPDCQKRCHDEMIDIFGDDERVPSVNDLKEMRYLEMCIKETMRLYPSVPMIGRKLGEDIDVGKHILPNGSNIFIIPYATHRLPHIFPDPEKFDPERFTPENCEKRHPYAYIPFAAGARNCIGYKFAMLEMKTIISRVLRSYELLPVPGKTTLEIVYRVTIRASGGMWIKLKERKNLSEVQA